MNPSLSQNTWLRAWSGPFTAELERALGPFGLGQVPLRLEPDGLVSMVCGYCSTGCGLTVHRRAGQAVNLTPDASYPVNLGMACPKGWEALTPLSAPDRLTTPMLRDPQTGKLESVSWIRAMSEFVSRMRGIQERHGKHSIAYLSTGQITTEEMALLGSVFKFGMGGLHGDSNTRQCMATSHVAYKQSFGFDAPPFTYADFETSDVLVFVGSNPCIAHPIMWQRVLRNPNRPAIVVLDPRRTETAVNATLHLALQPKSDLVLLYGIAAALLEAGAVKWDFIRRHTTDFDEFAAFVREFTPERVCAVAGLERRDFDRCVELIAHGQRVSFWWTMGVNQGHESTRTAQAIINLALMTGNIGRPGTGANSITGQCNAMGSRLFANVTSLLGGRDTSDPIQRAHVAEILGIPEAMIPAEKSWAYDQILAGIDTGDIRGLWVIATNPAQSWIDQHQFLKRMKGLDFLVVQDLYATTEMAQMADLVLPAAGWGEKDGTFINSERRIGLVKNVVAAPGEALSDFSIFRLVAEAWGCGHWFREWRSPAAAFQILKRLSVGLPCDFSGIRDYQHLDELGGIQWPFRPELEAQLGPDAVRERRLFVDGVFYHADGRARFVYEQPTPVGEPTTPEYPYVLLTGRGTSAQWHTNSRTGKSAVLRGLYPADLYLEIHPEDAVRLGLKGGGRVCVSSRRGSLLADVMITPTVTPGQVYLPMHYPEVNRLTFAQFDPYSRQPSFKHCAVALQRASGER